VGSQILDVGTFGSCLYDVPDGFSCDSRTPDLIEPTDSAKDHSTVDAGCRSPLIDGAFPTPEQERSGCAFLCQSGQRLPSARREPENPAFRSAPPLFQDLLREPAGSYDAATLAFCEKAAEHGVLAAQLKLARTAWTGRSNEGDTIRAYKWLSVALDEIAVRKNNVKRAMSPAQLAEAERSVREWLNKARRFEPSTALGETSG
jgi:hypothetical protein